MTDDLRATVAQRLGIPEADITDEQILAALDEALAERAEEAPESTPVVDGAVLVEAGALAELQRQAALGASAYASAEKSRRASIVQTAINEGRIAPASREHFLALLGDNEAEAVKALNGFPKGTIPVAELGHDEPEQVTEKTRLAAKAGWAKTEKEA